MPVDLHYICKRGENYKWLGDNRFRTGNWTAGDDLADMALGGRLFLHTAQKELAWHGGTIIDWQHASAPEENRKVFFCRREFEYGVQCIAPWSQQIAIAWWNEDRSELLSRDEYLKLAKSKLPTQTIRLGTLRQPDTKS
jgi:hypothetical protein